LTKVDQSATLMWLNRRRTYMFYLLLQLLDFEMILLFNLV